jgi:flagellar basal-body rod modification protein FlgD
MQTSAVSTGITSSATPVARGMSGLQSEDFFKILVTELQQQDPLQPGKTSDLIGQVSQIRSIELSQNLTDALTQITRHQRVAGASELIGKFVTATLTGTDGTSQEVSGLVTGVRFDPDGTAVLELDTGQSVPAESVTRITSAANAASAGTTGGTTGATSSSGDSATATNKTEANAKASYPRILPFVSLDGEFHL